MAARAKAIEARRIANKELERGTDARPSGSVSAEPVGNAAPRGERTIWEKHPLVAPALVTLVVLSGIWVLGPLVVAAKMYFEER